MIGRIRGDLIGEEDAVILRPLFLWHTRRNQADNALRGGIPDYELSRHVGDHHALPYTGQDGFQDGRLLRKLLFGPLAGGDVLIQFLIDGAELFRLLSHPVAYLEQVDEHRDLRFQYFRDERFKEIIHGANGITSEHVCIHGVRGRQENDRRMAGPRTSTNQRRRLKPTQPRHPYVEQDDGEVLL